jgi:hypothetical protein
MTNVSMAPLLTQEVPGRAGQPDDKQVTGRL